LETSYLLEIEEFRRAFTQADPEESREAFLWSHTGILASILTLTIAFNQNKPFYSVMFSVHSSMLDGIFHPTSFFRHVFIKFL
jgi:hypothetical protein